MTKGTRSVRTASVRGRALSELGRLVAVKALSARGRTIAVAACLAGFICCFLPAAVLTGAVPVVNSIGKEMPPDAAPLDQQVFRYTLVEPLTFDVSINIYEGQGALTLFERLVMLDKNLELVGAAASSWEQSADGLRWTFKLRPDGRWSDGRTVTAHDFEYTYKRFLDPAVASPYAFFYYEIKGARPFNQGSVTDPSTVGVRALDDFTLEIETEKPCPYLPFIVAFTGSGPVPRWQVEKHGARWSEAGNLVANASYTLSEWQKGRQATLTLNPYYTGPHKGYLEKIVQIFTTGHPGTPPYENDEIDYLRVMLTDLPFIENHPTLKSELAFYAFPETWYLFFKTREPPFDDVRVRRAISQSIDREALCSVVLRNTGVPAYSMLPPKFPGSADASIRAVQAYDTDRARALLAEAGYPGGKGFPTIDFWIGKSNPQISYTAQAIQAMLGNTLGLRLRMRGSEDKVYRDNMYEWNIPMGLGGFNADYPDPNNLLGMVWRSQPRGFGRQDWRNDDFDRLIDAAADEMDHDKRMNMYQEAERILVEDVGGAFLYHNLTVDLRKPYLKGLEVNKFGYAMFSWIGIMHTEMYIARH